MQLAQPRPGWMHAFPYDKTAFTPKVTFPDHAWAPRLKARAITTAVIATPGWIERCDPGPADLSEAVLETDKALLRKLLDAGDRNDPDLGPAIKAQAVNTVDYWAYLLGCSAASRPATWLLVLVSFEAAAQIASFFKLKYNRPRPVQVWTAIAPSIPTPLSPSYPSGHALESFHNGGMHETFRTKRHGLSISGSGRADRAQSGARRSKFSE